ncbi:MAG: extracellular solute-binding protein [Chloroflexi bacterium]|uniref:extracellular solute-binding protein n=1 Tax=Candidatus Flexifilum breve TaxID=3140694 RepID=UPI003135C96E|nr:extracellular solute-binding protein [Chloroflexota bacterium]
MSWYTQDHYQPVLDAFLAQYPDVQIDYQNVPPANNQYVQRLQLLASSGELPDLFYSGPPITLMAENGYLADITDLEVVQACPKGTSSTIPTKIVFTPTHRMPGSVASSTISPCSATTTSPFRPRGMNSLRRAQLL